MTKKRGSLLFIILVILCLLSPITVGALMKMPDIGIDYKTMTVNQPAKLMAAGMKDVKKGDKIKMDISEDGVITFTNEKNGAKAIIKPLKADNPR